MALQCVRFAQQARTWKYVLGRLAGCRSRQEDPRIAPTRSALLECLFNEARRYREKANVVDHVEDRIKFIESGSVELPRPRERLGIAFVAETARRFQLIVRSINLEQGHSIAQLSRRAMTFVPDKQMCQSARNIIRKVDSWARSRSRAEPRLLRAVDSSRIRPIENQMYRLTAQECVWRR